MSNCADGPRLASDELLGEIAATLAIGLLRLPQRAAAPVRESAEISPQRPPEGLSFATKRGSVCVSVDAIRDSYQEPKA